MNYCCNSITNSGRERIRNFYIASQFYNEREIIIFPECLNLAKVRLFVQ